MTDLFDYPNHPGFRTGGASMEAAVMMKKTGKAESTAKLVLEYLKQGHVETSEIIAARIGRKHGNVKSRLSELLKSGLVTKLEQRGQGSCGIAIHKWQIA
jgi:predicted HTH transcriptional regulator